MRAPKKAKARQPKARQSGGGKSSGVPGRLFTRADELQRYLESQPKGRLPKQVGVIGVLRWLEDEAYFGDVGTLRRELSKISNQEIGAQAYSNWKARGKVPQDNRIIIAMALLGAYHARRCETPDTVHLCLAAIRWWYAHKAAVTKSEAMVKFLKTELPDYEYLSADGPIKKLLFDFVWLGEPVEEDQEVVSSDGFRRIRHIFKVDTASDKLDLKGDNNLGSAGLGSVKSERMYFVKTNDVGSLEWQMDTRAHIRSNIVASFEPARGEVGAREQSHAISSLSNLIHSSGRDISIEVDSSGNLNVVPVGTWWDHNPDRLVVRRSRVGRSQGYVWDKCEIEFTSFSDILRLDLWSLEQEVQIQLKALERNFSAYVLIVDNEESELVRFDLFEKRFVFHEVFVLMYKRQYSMNKSSLLSGEGITIPHTAKIKFIIEAAGNQYVFGVSLNEKEVA